MTSAVAPKPTLVESVTVSASPTIYPSPPSTIVTSVNIPVRDADNSVPSAVVAVMVSLTTKVPTNVVTTSSMTGTFPILRVVTLDTNAVAEDVPPTIVKPLKFK